MAEPFLSEIRLVSFNFPPKGWAFCNGQLLPINQNQALFSLLGTTYGGNGQTTFALPDLRGRVPMHLDATHPLGTQLGTDFVTLTAAEIPDHTHAVMGSASGGDSPVPTGNVLANSPSQLYADPTHLTTLHPSSISSVGGSQAHENRQPYLTLSFCIALQGIFPSPN